MTETKAKLQSIYLSVSDMRAEVDFWTAVLQSVPLLEGSTWSEFGLGNARMALLLDEDAAFPVASTATPVLEVSDSELDAFIERAQSAGGSVVMQGLAGRIIMASPSGHRFELSMPRTSAA